MNESASQQPDNTLDGKSSPDALGLAYELSGALPCATCGYDLSGLSILERCPECGTRIRDTLLVVVDPFADSVPKVRRPRVIAFAVAGTATSGFAAAMCLIVHRAASLACNSNVEPCGIGGLDLVGVALVCVAGVLTLGMLRPLRSIKASGIVGAAFGAIAITSASGVMWVTLLARDTHRSVPYLNIGQIEQSRVIEHLLAHALLLIGVVLLRPNARAVSSATWRLRENHDNKQRLATLAASLAVIIVGDGVLLVGAQIGQDLVTVLAVAGGALVLVGSGVLAAALYSVLTDSWRIARTLWRVPIAFRDVVRRTPE